MEFLSIGNSFSQDMLTYVKDIAINLGHSELEIANYMYPGCSVDQHIDFIENNKNVYWFETNYSGEWIINKDSNFKDTFNDRKWEIISLQQASWLAGDSDSYKNLNKLIEIVRKYSDAKLVWQMTWAYQQDTNHPAFPQYNSDQMNMYNKILESAKQNICTNKDISVIIPSGTAVQNARTSSFGDKITRDGFHMSEDLGRLLVGLTFIKAVYNWDISKCTFIPNGSDEFKLKLAIESAINAVKNPFEITKSQL